MREINQENLKEVKEIICNYTKLESVLTSGAVALGYFGAMAFTWFVSGFGQAVSNTLKEDLEPTAQFVVYGFLGCLVAVGVVFIVNFIIKLITYFNMSTDFNCVDLDNNEGVWLENSVFKSKLKILGIFYMIQKIISSVPALFLGMFFIVGGWQMWKEAPDSANFVFIFIGIVPIIFVIRAVILSVAEFRKKYL